MSSALPIPVERTQHPRRPCGEGELKFGRVFTDHMFLLDWEEGAGWNNPRLVPFGPLASRRPQPGCTTDRRCSTGSRPSAATDGKVRIFRLDRHVARMAEGAKRLCMPAIDPELMREAVLEFVRLERDWVPSAPGTSLYLRPTMFATEPFLGVRPATNYLFFIIASPVGAYYAEGMGPVRIRIEDQIRARGARRPGRGEGGRQLRRQPAGRRRGEEGRLRPGAVDRRHRTRRAGRGRHDEPVRAHRRRVRDARRSRAPSWAGSPATASSPCCAAGATRSTSAASWSRSCCARSATGALKEVFGTGTAAVISPVGELGWKDQRFLVADGQPGEMSQKLFTAITDIQYGRAPDPDGWRPRR